MAVTVAENRRHVARHCSTWHRKAEGVLPYSIAAASRSVSVVLQGCALETVNPARPWPEITCHIVKAIGGELTDAAA
jgi:hypothetical protein